MYNFLKDIKQSFTKFFFVYLAMVVATFSSILNSHKIVELSQEYLFGTYIIIVALSAVRLFVQSRGLSFVFHLFFIILSLGIVFGSLELFFSSIGFLSLGMLVFLMISSSLPNNKSFLGFNLNLSFISFFALISSIILYLGIVGIIKSVVYLFGIELWNKVYEDIAIVVFTLVFPTIIISNISKPLVQSFVRPVEILIKYILTPLLMVYLVILYAYFIKVGIMQELPKGSIANMVIYYGISGLFTFILIDTIEHKNKLLVLYKDYFFYTLIIPLCFLYFAIYLRVEQYGFTESRYALFVITLWLSISVGYFFIKREKVLFKNIFLVLSILLFISYATPFSATKISVDSQLDRFTNFLDKHGLLKDTQAIASKKELSLEQRIEITSVIQYMQSNDSALIKLEPYFKSLKKDQSMQDIKWELLELLNIQPAFNTMKKPEFKEYKTYKFSQGMPWVQQNSYVSYLHMYEKGRYGLYYFDDKGIKRDILISMQNNHLMVQLNKKNIVFNILRPLQNHKENSISKDFIIVKNNIVLKIQNLELKKNEIIGMEFYLIIGSKK